VTSLNDVYGYVFNPDIAFYPDGAGLTITCGRKTSDEQTLVPMGFLTDNTRNYASLWGDFTITCKDGLWRPMEGVPPTAYMPIFRGDGKKLHVKSVSCKLDLSFLFEIRKKK
jgi:hypothetical protein